ncbi:MULTISPECIES: hypothetical protein [unclassified Sphingomonas]|uniref:hypothetical protein n=1 Tax=unclassified Sphingomonas TaxID=196159 RepID=UPI0007022DDF|nr:MULTISPECIES: hypothetical protein [unclassified Sphingomonas]KQN07176.1 hypothetical protein ASE78_13190 [Sphingomonas sp. Leaf25]KQN39665.1 hypothetical protein ASE97_06300 [Sphingomonas sp. Leaf42]KQT28940.1 hypothetical protein ASG37_09010 [Sphingomonas sp. Leaf407]
MRALFAAAAVRVAIVAAGLLVPTFAAQANEIERNGYTFDYTSTTTTDGATVLAGTIKNSGEPFRFVVRDRLVTGNVDGREVRFRIAKPLNNARQLAAR